MSFRDFVLKRLGNWGKESKGGNYILTQRATAPERNITDCLSAYGSVFSLFGIAQRIASAMSEVKWRLYKGSERSERSQISEHPVLDLLDYANEFQTGQEIMELHSIYSDCAGKVFWYLPRNKLGIPGEIWLLPPHKVKIITSKKDFIAGYIFDPSGEQIPLDKKEIIWFSMPNPLNQVDSIGFAQAASVEIASEDYAGRWNRNFFYNSARADAVIETESNISEEDFERLKLQWNTEHRGLGSAHKIAILQGGMKYKQTQIMPKDMDFSQLRKQTRENLLFTFGMPLSVMGVSENVNKANAEAGDYTFARWLIKPRLNRIKGKLNEQLLPMFNAKGLEIDFDEVVPETIDQKRTLAESGLRSGSMTINESRKLYGLEPLPPESGDVLLIPLNMIATPIKSFSKSVKKSIFPDEERKEAYWKLYVNKASIYERKIIDNLREMFGKQEKEVINNLGKESLFNKNDAKADFKQAVENPLKKLIEETIEDTEELITPAKSKQNVALLAALEWLKTRINWAAEEVGNETERILASQLATGHELGEDVSKLTRRVEQVFEHCKRERAMTIARTETISASTQGAIEGYKEVGVEKLEFYTAQDERTCEDCESLHGEQFDIGDSVGVIPVHPMCRCTFLAVI